ncbi:XrtA/PEP-CTERM system TPR-repeat protein PrsT [Roseateles sp. GG27B]
MPRTPWFLIRLALLPLLLSSTGVLALPDSGKAARFYEDALGRYERRDLPGAIIQLKNALQIDKTLLPVHVLLGKSLLLSGEAANAEIELTEALRLGVNRAEVVVALAQSLAAQGKPAQIFEDTRLTPAGLPAGVQLQLLLVRAAAASDTGDVRTAAKIIQEARALDPKDVGSWLAEVPLRIRAGQFAEAQAAAEQALKLAPELSEAHYQKGSALHVQGQIQAALSAYEQALKLDSGHVEAKLARAGIWVDLRRDKDARADLKELQLLAPDDPRGVYLGALLAERAGDIAGARAALKNVTELLDPVPIEFIRYRSQALMLNGLAHYGLGELEKAKPYLEYALRQQANSPLAKLLAKIHLAEANMNRAAEVLEGYLKVHPGDGQALLMLASTQMAQGRHARATALMQEALRAKDSPEFRASLGLSLMQSGQNANATDELEKAFKDNPKQAYAGLALVTLHLRSGQTAKALAVAQSLVTLNPGNPSALLVLGMAKTRAADYVGARGAFEKALKIDAKLTEGQLGLVRVEIATAAFDAADKRLRDMLKTDQRQVDALFEMALLNEVRGRDDEALRWLEKAADYSSLRDTRANFALVAWHLRKGQAAKALDAAKQLLGKAPDDLQVLQTYARAQLANNDPAGARASLTKASRRAAFEAPAQVEIARLQLQVKDSQGAAYSLDKALIAQPEHLPALALMTALELQQGESAKAERRARQIIQSWPKLALGYSLLADVALSRSQTTAALESLRRAHEVEPSSDTLLRLFRSLASQDGGKPAIEVAERWLNVHPQDLPVQRALADAQARAGNFTAARRAYDAALKLHPDDADLLNNLANVLLRLKDPAALKVAEQALSLNPRNPLLVDTAGWANHLAGNKDRALQLLRDALLRQPANPEIRYHLAAVLAQAGRKAEARTELTQALKVGSNFESGADAETLRNTLK